MNGLHRTLRARTELHHQRIERAVRLLDPALGRAGYVRFLEKMFGFYAPLEERLGRISGLDEAGVSLASRRKLPLLARDLAVLGVADPSILPACLDLPAVDGPARALGCLYVLEGSTLGGAILVRRLGPSLGLDVDHGLAFLNSYGTSVGSMWRSFLDALARWAEGRDREAEVVEGAIETFTRLERWLTGEGTEHGGQGPEQDR